MTKVLPKLICEIRTHRVRAMNCESARPLESVASQNVAGRFELASIDDGDRD